VAEGYILNEPEQRSIFAAGPAQKSILKTSIKISWTNTLRKNWPMFLLIGCDAVYTTFCTKKQACILKLLYKYNEL
jgi:hypothetical protein